MEDTLTIGAFVVGATQLVKDIGVQGDWLKIVALAWAVFAQILIVYFPELWASLSSIVLATTATGLVSFGNEKLQQLKAPAGQ